MDIAINEVFGPVWQGEGLDIGRPCIFVRLQHCPVKCPGCDSGFTWNGTEEGTRLRVLHDPGSSVGPYSLQFKLGRLLEHNLGCGIVVSGGEPLLYYKHRDFKKLLMSYRNQGHWIGLETSGFPALAGPDLDSFLDCFTSIHVSPKVTPCLHGAGWSDEQLLSNAQVVVESVYLSSLRCLRQTKLALKFVCRDEADIDVVSKVINASAAWKSLPIYLMPYGQDLEEIKKTSEFLLPYCSKYGYILSPRLQSLFYGKQRGV